MDKFTRIGSLYEFYGALLSKRQREATALYYEENCSLAEIAEEFGISRQGVYDALHSAEKALEGYEEKLGLVHRFEEQDEKLAGIQQMLQGMLKAAGGKGDSAALAAVLTQVTALREEGLE
ncbi:MAG: YlxM family DNA-binding protein [Clostridiales bacterium]|nr:YlxM family DNA-binding protein [Clostridiales bacterium]